MMKLNNKQRFFLLSGVYVLPILLETQFLYPCAILLVLTVFTGFVDKSLDDPSRYWPILGLQHAVICIGSATLFLYSCSSLANTFLSSIYKGNGAAGDYIAALVSLITFSFYIGDYFIMRKIRKEKQEAGELRNEA